MGFKRWNISQADTIESTKIASKYNIPLFAAQVLSARGLNAETADICMLTQELENPFVLKDMQKAVDRINLALNNEEKICIYGDYDADGITSTVMLYSYLSDMGADILYYIPDRDDEGYGLNKDALERIAQSGVNLIITVDNGISAIDEAEYAKTLGLDIIITDHHQPREILPDAVAVINPHRKDCPSKFKLLCGAGVAFKLIAAMEDGEYSTVLDMYSDIVAIATIADIVPLISENRTIVQYGLNALLHTDNIGIEALINKSGVKNITSENIAFTVVPRINAAGRLGEVFKAVNLLSSGDEEEAEKLANELEELNKSRKDLEKAVLDDIQARISADPSLLNERVLIFSGEGWHHGIIGIVCAKIVETYSKPCILISIENGEARGSARGIEGFSIFEAIKSTEEILKRFGGHSLAAGFSLKPTDIDEFCRKISDFCKMHYNEMPDMTIKIDREIELKEINVSNAQGLSMLEPFGKDFEKPIFAVTKAEISGITSLSEGKHIRLTVRKDNNTAFFMLFNSPFSEFPYTCGDKVDIAFTLTLNEYNGELRVSAFAKDIRLSGVNEAALFKAKQIYEKILRNEHLPISLKDKILPQKEDVAAIYRYLRENESKPIQYFDLCSRLQKLKINYCKMMLSIKVLQQSKLIHLTENNTICNISICKTNGKVDIEKYLEFSTISFIN